MARPPVPPIDYTNVGYESLRDAMLAQARASLPEWTDYSENDLGVLLVELFAHASDITLYYQTRIAANLFPATADEPDALVQLLRFIGYELRPPSPATAELRVWFKPPTTITGSMQVPAGTRLRATTPSGEGIDYETERELVIRDTDLSSFNGVTPRALQLLLPVVQGTTRSAESVAISDGSPMQLYALEQRPVLAGGVTIAVTEPGGIVTRWQEAETFAASAPVDRHFLVRRDVTGGTTILFGDGTNGFIPPAGAPIVATYRTGGGVQGNIPARTRFTVATAGPFQAAVQEVTNEHAASGGAAGESLDRARRLAPRLFRAQDRAVTLADYEDLARQFPGVGKARAVALNWNEVVLYVAPEGQVAAPSELLRRDLLAYFEHRRMAATFVQVLGPAPADIFIKATVQAKPYFRQADVRAAVEQAVARYLAFENVEFGERIYLSRIYDAIQSLDEVSALHVDEFARVKGGGIESDGVIELSPSQLPRPGYRDHPDPDIATPDRVPVVTTIQGGVP